MKPKINVERMKPKINQSAKKNKKLRKRSESNLNPMREGCVESPPQLLSKESKQSAPSDEEQLPKTAFQYEGSEEVVDESKNEPHTVPFQSTDNQRAVGETKNNAGRRGQILKILEEGAPYKAEALSFMEARGKLAAEEENLVIKYLYDFEINNRYLVYEYKKPGRMLDDRKWRRTITGAMIDGISHVFAPRQRGKVRPRCHSDENGNVGQKGGVDNHSHRNEQLISPPSKEKYGHLPQFRWPDIGEHPTRCFGNSEDIEGFLVGGREKLQEIRKELQSYSSPSSKETSEEDIEGLLSSPSYQPSPSCCELKTINLWGVSIFRDDCESSGSGGEDGSNY